MIVVLHNCRIRRWSAGNYQNLCFVRSANKTTFGVARNDCFILTTTFIHCTNVFLAVILNLPVYLEEEILAFSSSGNHADFITLLWFLDWLVLFTVHIADTAQIIYVPDEKSPFFKSVRKIWVVFNSPLSKDLLVQPIIPGPTKYHETIWFRPMSQSIYSSENGHESN